MKKLVVGLGNPGREFLGTRHNVGYMVVEKVAERNNLHFKKGKGVYLEAKGKRREKNFILAKPLSYMNLSGVVVRDIMEIEDVKLENLLVVYDDIDLPLGKLRFRMKGSSGGHKGISSVIWSLMTEEIQRMKVGIGRPPEGISVTEWVLSEFDRDISDMLERAAFGVEVWIEHGIEKAMNMFNE